ncbi:MAG: sugar phosphate isomerase/epimerase family protein [Christensenellales bacterium]|jgi:L-ribulose-5-phosphate 3-epimerase
MAIRKGINIWSFDSKLTIRECMELAKDAGFEGIELALSAKGPLSLQSSESDIAKIRKDAEEIGITINALATGLYWQYSLTSSVQWVRDKAMEVAKCQIAIASKLGADTVLICPGAVGVDFQPEEVVPDAQDIEYFVGSEVIDYEVAYDRALAAFRELAPVAAEHQVYIGIENIWNKFLLSPLEMRQFIDEVDSPWVGAWVDVANMLMFGYPEQWIRILGKRIVKVHFKDFRRAVNSLHGFVDLLSGDVNWKAVKEALDAVGYKGWANAEMTPTYQQYTDQMIYNCSAAMDRILQRPKQQGKVG